MLHAQIARLFALSPTWASFCSQTCSHYLHDLQFKPQTSPSFFYYLVFIINKEKSKMTITKTSQSNMPVLRCESSMTTTSSENMDSTAGKGDIFPISHLPPELRHKIYVYYYTSLPATESKTHLSTPLALASPFLAADIPPSIFYSAATFSFSSGDVLRDFAQRGRNSEIVKRIRIVTGREKREQVVHRDWVYLISSHFEGLGEVVFDVERGSDGFGGWWDCVKDAVREGWCCQEGRGRKMILGCHVGELEMVREILKT